MGKEYVENVELHAVKAYPNRHTVEIYADAYDDRGKILTTIHSPVYEETELFATGHKPLVTIGEEAAQELFQSLWDMGCRPKSQDGNVGMLQATQDHLKDMRRIVSNKLKVEL